VDALNRSDLELDAKTTQGQKLVEALELMSVGMRLERQRLRQKHPEATDQQLEELFLAWLLEHD
jgi:hypothetical protein